MARVRYVEKEQARDEAVGVFEEFERRGRNILNPFKLAANSPKLLDRWWKLMFTLVYELKLDAKLRELALLRIFQLVGCDYCFAEHDRIARRVGVTADQVTNINEYAAHPAFNDLERLVLRYTDMVSRTGKGTDEIFAELRKHFDEQEIVELTFCIGNWNGVARFITGMEMDLEPEDAERLGKA